MYCGIIAQEVLNVCTKDSIPTVGLEQELIWINVEDLPYSGITFNATNPDELIDEIALSASKTGYRLQGMKDIIKASSTFENSEDGESGEVHQFTGVRVNDPSVTAQKFRNQLRRGAKGYIVYEVKHKGESRANAFKIAGITHGLVLKESVQNTGENDGVYVLTIGTPAGHKEPFEPHQLLDTDYDTTKTAFLAKFAAGE